MQFNLMIRSGRLEDIPTIQSLATQTWADTYSGIISQQQIAYMLEKMYSEKVLVEELNQAVQFFIAAAENDATIGFASISHFGIGFFKLHKLYVLPAYQKNQAGKLLLDATLNYAAKNDGKQVFLQVNKANQKAINFYFKHSFSILYQADFYIGDDFFMNDYVMGKNI